MIVYFLRHASAGQRKSSGAADDKRALDSDGIEQCRYVGRLLAGLDVQPDVIISSPLKRALQTAAFVANELGHETKIQQSPALKPGATNDAFRRLLAENDGREYLMVVGHNPSLTEFASLLVSDGASSDALELKKGAVAKIELQGTRSGTLQWCFTPKIARAAHELARSSSRPKTSRK